VRKRVVAFLPDAKCLGGGFQKEVVVTLEEAVWVLKVIIYPSLVGANTDSGILISIWTLVLKEFILAICILCGTST
jgi:hypothetical protein